MRTRWVWTLVGCAVLGTASVALALGRGDAQMKVPGAKRVASVATWNLKYTSYWWLSSHDVVFLRGSFKQGWTFCRLDTRTGKSEALEGLSSFVRRAYGKATMVALSPDRSSALVQLYSGRLRVVSLNGRSLYEDAYETSAAEGPGGRRAFASEPHMGSGAKWVEAAYPYPVGNGPLSHLFLHDARAPGAAKKVTFQPALAARWPGLLTAQNRFLMAGWNDHVEQSGAGRISLDVAEVDLNAAHPAPRTTSIPLPEYMQSPLAVVFAPGGDRVALLADSSETPSYAGGRLSGARRGRFALWVSGVRGERMHEVGSFPYEETVLGLARMRRLRSESCLRWLPDGRTLSFIYGGSLWTVPAG